ncbi:HAMP domain-containing protein [Bacillus thermotolerans]|uniref:Methyl-accepting chemotaxis protein n=1 Tax=Bacillus thermotolerans TaxID=1221996 RepID=A0A0F5HVN8_BACTR|nr:HAMP domain-containing protein [Bacillus thermotolerans]KKB37454.1 Methyl-accepting chemotaxis protein [Bacillus thermotolerans]KKB39508.1 Methyl-accepting chemotaxis protein [Bacillus thermotolerans]
MLISLDLYYPPFSSNWLSIIFFAATGEYVVTVSKPVTVEGQVMGAVGADIGLAHITSQIEGMNIGYNGSALVMSPQGAGIVHATEQGGDLTKYAHIDKLLSSEEEAGIIRYEEVAKGDLSVQMPVASKDEIGELASAFNRMVESMRSIISVMNHSAENVTEAAEHLRAVSEETNASSEQITVAINEVAAGATRSAEESSDAAEQSHRLGEQIAVISSGADRLTKTARQTEEAQEEGIRQIQALGTSSAETSLYIEEAEKVILALETKITSIERIMQTITDISS